MTILSRAEIGEIAENTLRRRWMVGEVLNLLETCLAMHAALQAWAKWFHTPNNLIDLTLLQIAADLTEAAGIDWPEEGDA